MATTNLTPKFPFFDLTRQYETLKQEILPVVHKVFEKQAFVMGEEVTQFEKEVADYIGVKYAVTCSSGTDALVLALKTLGIGPGDEVITPPFSFFASTSSILLCGAKPIFVDIEPKHFNLDPEKVAAAITPRTKAIMPVHLFGQCADMDPILKVAKSKGIAVVEDFAQSIGAKYFNRGAGGMGTMGATSFYPTKNLGGAGEGGLVTTNDETLAEKAKLLRVHGMKVRYTHDILGWNSRMDALQAAVLRVKLRHLDKWVARRRQLASRYQEAFGSLEKEGKLQLPVESANRFHVWNQFTILVSQRDSVRSKLEQQGIPTDIFYPKTIPVQPALKNGNENLGSFPVGEECASRALALPIFPELTDDEQSHVIKALMESV